MEKRPELWEIAIPGTDQRWADNRGGSLFVSYRMAQRTFDKYKNAMAPFNAAIVPCELDADLAQMGDLYHETHATQ